MKSMALNIKRIVSFFIASVIFVLLVTAYSSGNASAINTSMSYTIFTAFGDAEKGFEAGDYMGEYTLSANSVVDMSRDYVVVDDERQNDETVEGVVKIVTDDGLWGTGFIVGEHTIATNAHVVFDDYNGSFQNSGKGITNIYIFDENGNIKADITSAYDVHVPNAYISYDNNSAYDYAMVTVTDSLSDYMCFNLGAMTDSIVGTDLAVYCTGFPQFVRGKTVNSTTYHNKYTDYGNIVSVTGETNEQVFYYDVDISGGNSGGPIYIKTQYQNEWYYTAIGITSVATTSDGVTFLRGGGIRMTTNLLHFYKNNPNIEY